MRVTRRYGDSMTYCCPNSRSPNRANISSTGYVAMTLLIPPSTNHRY
jgi:hypothetical protein